MKLNPSVLIAFIVLVLAGAVLRNFGFAPQIALAVFAAAVFRNRLAAFALPVLSLFLSDLYYQFQYTQGNLEYPGFYEGILSNYILLASLPLIGLWARNLNPGRIALATLAAPTVYFLLSNFTVWAGGGGYQRPFTFEGLLMSYNDGLPFYRTDLVSTVVFSTILFGGYFLVQRLQPRKQLA